MNRRPLTRLQITGLILVGILLALCALLAALRRPVPALPPAATESIGGAATTDSIAAEAADSAAPRTKKARKPSRTRPATPPPAPRSPLDESF